MAFTETAELASIQGTREQDGPRAMNPNTCPTWFPTGISRVLSPPSPPPPSYLVTVIPWGPQLSPAPGLGGALQGKTQKHGRIAPVRVAGIPVPGVPMTKA